MTSTLLVAVSAAGSILAAPFVHAHDSMHAAVDLQSAWVGREVRDIYGRWVGKVRDAERGRDGVHLNIVIAVGSLPHGGERYVVVPVQHLQAERGGLRFLGPRERLVDAPRIAPR
jgi:hypothetical protein